MALVHKHMDRENSKSVDDKSIYAISLRGSLRGNQELWKLHDTVHRLDLDIIETFWMRTVPIFIGRGKEIKKTRYIIYQDPDSYLLYEVIGTNNLQKAVDTIEDIDSDGALSAWNNFHGIKIVQRDINLIV